MTNLTQVHFVGIGGAGMSPLASILLQSGIQVTGSDCKESAQLSRLTQEGAVVHVGHSATNLISPDLVVVSLAVDPANPEVIEAGQRGIPVVTRAQLLGKLFNEKRGIGISGTHGKTTTASMIAYALMRAGKDPTIAVGGEIMDLGYSGRLGSGEYFVAEADEAFKSFFSLEPFVSIITSVDEDHVDHYGSFDNVISGFSRYACQTRRDGCLIACADHPTVLQAIKGYSGRLILYGTTDGDYVVDDCRFAGGAWRFVLRHGQQRMEVPLLVPGLHNALNATAALVACATIGMDIRETAEILREFHGARRRSELIGSVGGVTVYDDYAHHPSEIRATLRAFRTKHSGRLIAVFQPQRFSRTRLLMDRFAEAFADADLILVDDIFYRGTGESPLSGVSSRRLAELIESVSCKPALYIPGKPEIVSFLSENAQEGDLVITMGAGDIRECAVELVENLGGTPA